MVSFRPNWEETRLVQDMTNYRLRVPGQFLAASYTVAAFLTHMILSYLFLAQSMIHHMKVFTFLVVKHIPLKMCRMVLTSSMPFWM